MNPFYYISIIISGLLAICYLVILLQKTSEKNKFTRKFILALAYGLLCSIVAASFWSEYELSQEVNKLKELQSSIASRSFDSLSLSQEQRRQILDSLNIEADELDAILNAVKLQNAITGGGTKTIDDIYNAKIETQKQHNEIIKFNTIISDKQVSMHRKGYHLKSASSAFTFLPPQDTASDYIDLGLYFHDETIIPKVGIIYIEVVKTNHDDSLTLIEDIYYEPQNGLNKFRIKNYFKDPKVYARIGFFWKDDLEKTDYPTYESIKYQLSK